MKKLISLLLVAAMLLTVAPMTALARNEYISFAPVDGCQLNELSFTQADNPWLLWDVTFEEINGETVLQTTEDHPGLVGCEVIPAIAYEGNHAYFNDVEIIAGEAIKLEAENELVVVDTVNHNRAEYTVLVTEESNGLPVVLIDTDGADIPDKLNYVPARISVLGSEVYDAENIYYADTSKGGIKLRGNSTMGYDKKPYRIKFKNKENVLGLGNAKSWVLLADYLDPSSLRNQVAFNLANRINSYTAESTGFKVFSPRMRLVEVYLNGEYKGLYEMGDHMQANEHRVNISEWGDEDSTAPGETIGYFIEVEVQSRVLTEGAEGYEDWSAYSWIENVGSASGHSQDPDKTDDIEMDALYFQFKLPEEPSDEQKEYITKLMQEVNDKILRHDDTVWEIIDMDSVIDWYLVNELFKNVDSQMQSSVYFFKDGTVNSDGEDITNPNTKLYMGPVWDFDLGAGGVAYGEMDDPTGWRTRNDEYCGWFREMFEMDSFKTAVEARWADLHKEGILEAMYTDITSLEAMAGDAAKANYATWHTNYVDEVDGTWMEVPAISTESDSWEAQVDYFESYLNARIAWMDEQFGVEPETVLGTVTEEATLFSDEVYTTSSAGKVSHTYTVDEKVDLDMLAFALDIDSDTAFNFGFDLTVATNSSAGSDTFTMTPSAMDDWQASGETNPFVGTTGAYIAAGTYNDRILKVSNAMRWQLWANYKSYMEALGFTGWTKIDLSQVVKSVRLNSVTVTFENASVGDSATFTLQNVDENGDPMMIDKTIIIGKPSIMGEPVVGNTLFASTTEILPYSASVEYQWYADGNAISNANSNSYTLTASNLGKQITVEARATGYYSGTVTSDAKTVTKSARTTLAATPVLESVTADSLTVAAGNDVEYSLDGITWQTSATFTDLEANTVYTVFARAPEHDTKIAGAVSAPLYVITDVLGTVQGDVNGNGKIDTTDAVWVLEQALDFAVMKNETMIGLCDVNGDGKINTLDSRFVLKQIVNDPSTTY